MDHGRALKRLQSSSKALGSQHARLIRLELPKSRPAQFLASSTDKLEWSFLWPSLDFLVVFAAHSKVFLMDPLCALALSS